MKDLKISEELLSEALGYEVDTFLGITKNEIDYTCRRDKDIGYEDISINIYEFAFKNLKQWAKLRNVFDIIDWSEEPEQIFKKVEKIRGRTMTLNELDKNSKFGYRRRSWYSKSRDYVGFNGEEWIHIDSRGTDYALLRADLEGDDWYLSDIPNKYHKRVAVLTKSHGEKYWPIGTRIIKTNAWSESFNQWMLADHSTERIEFHTIGIGCEWEDEMESELPCFRKWQDSRLVVESTVPQTIPENTSCSSEPITQHQHKKENTMDLRLLLAMMTAMSNEETPKDATNSKHVVIVTKDDAYEGYFYADDLESVKAIVAEPKNELKKFHVFDYQTTLGQKPRKVIEVDRC